MLSFSGSLKVFVAVEPCDMRRSFNGLHDAVCTRLMEDPKSGSIYAFTNKRRSRMGRPGSRYLRGPGRNSSSWVMGLRRSLVRMTK